MSTLTKKSKSAYKWPDCADERQRTLHLKFSPDSFLGSEKNVDHSIQWITFFRRNVHRFATDYLGIKLHLYQIIMLYLMGISNFIVVIASRACAKSFIIALFNCCRCLLYPGTMSVIASATKGQSKLLVSEKIEKELMNMSPVLKKEILKIKDNQNEVVLYFRNKSTITVVPASENGRGYRSNLNCREEFRMIKEIVNNSILSPFQIVRQAPYMMDDFYGNIKELQEEAVDVYISSSWIDNGHWMWKIVDQAFNEMLDGKLSCLLAFDESIPLKHKIKTKKYMQREIKKQDSLTWRIEFLNERVRENEHAFYTYQMLTQNQRMKRPFYPLPILDQLSGKKNPYSIPKQNGEIRLVSCDMAFVENKKNDNSIYSCIRLIPESTTYSRGQGEDVKVNNGFRMMVPYMESIQGGDVSKQAIRIRQLFSDWESDYIVLDTRNAGIAIYDLLAGILYDEARNIEYTPLKCMNDESVANRIRIEGAHPCIFAINASQKLNSDIAQNFRMVLEAKKIDLLIGFEQASEEMLPKMKEYTHAADASTQSFYESPFLETQALINECTSLMYEKKDQTGVIVVKEVPGQRKDRFTSVSYGVWFSSLLEKDLISSSDEYEYVTLID